MSIVNDWYNKDMPNLDCLRITIMNNLKKCNTCGRKCPYMINRSTLIYGFRLCWEHLPQSAKTLLKQYYLDTIDRDAHNEIFGDKI